jgi:hypothetical protein
MNRACRPALALLLIPASLAIAQKPSGQDVAALVAMSRQRALDYVSSLPDFVCTEVIGRYSYTYSGRHFGWQPKDKLTVKLSFFQKKEDHKLLTIDGRPTDRDFLTLEGATGAGEFGGGLYSIFEPSVEASFRWQGWKTVRRHRVAVFTYSVAQEHSHYLLVAGAPPNPARIFVGFHGDLEIDSTTGEVLHFTYIADHIPPVIKLNKVTTTVDYDSAEVAGRPYLLPAHSETTMEGNVNARNQIEFREYRKFSAESTVEFGPGK